METRRYQTRKQLAEMKKRGGIWIAKDLLTDVYWRSGLYYSKNRAFYFATLKINAMTTRQLHSFLKDNGYAFDETRARWVAESACLYE